MHNILSAPSCCVPVAREFSVNLTSITITWDRERCLDRNGNPHNYIIYYKKVTSTTAATIANISYNQMIRMYTANGLFPSTSYSFKIALQNEVGPGQQNQAKVITTMTPKGKPNLIYF